MNATTAAVSASTEQRFGVGMVGEVGAPAADVYRTIADYHDGHKRIVPPRYFRNLRVVEGGYGAGTVIEYDMRAYGTTQHARARITEPEPGRVLAETVPDRGTVTQFTVSSLGASRSRVEITTDLPVRQGIIGALQKRVFSRYLRRVFTVELAQLNRVMANAASELHRPGASP